MVRNYKLKIYDKKYHNIYMSTSILTSDNIDKLLISDKYSDTLKDIFLSYKLHLLGERTLGLWEIPKVEKIIKKHLRDIFNDHIYQYITLSPDHNLRKISFTDENVLQLQIFCEKWFNNIRYEFYQYVVECGKNKDDPHLHVHALVLLKHKKQGKNHARELKKFWEKFFPSSPLIGKDYYSTNVSGKYFLDKQSYFTDANKGSHENFMDLGIYGKSEETSSGSPSDTGVVHTSK